MAPRAQAAPTARPPLPALMAPERRLTLFLLAAATLVAIAATLTLVLPTANDGAQRAHRARAETGPVVLRSEAATELPVRASLRRQSSGRQGEPEQEDLPVGVRPRLRVQRTRGRLERRARAFVVALLRWEMGERGPEVRRSLRATATRRFARFLVSEAPRVPAGAAAPVDGRIARVESEQPARARALALALAQVTVTRPGVVASVLLVELVRVEGRWRAAALR
jgi:hypothetical protein